MKVLESIHQRFVYDRRLHVLAKQVANLIPQGVRVLDVGCGDGLLAKTIMEMRPDVSITGLDVLVRPVCHIETIEFDGKSIPFPDRSFDTVMFVDVLHHCEDPEILIGEALRVTTAEVVIKDHTRDGFMAGPTLRFMDYIGNARHGVSLPYNYWSRSRWSAHLDELPIELVRWEDDLGLYPWPANLFFERKLHFVAKLRLLERNSRPAMDIEERCGT